MFPKAGKKLPHRARSGDAYADAIAEALRTELGATHRATKTLMRWTGASERTAEELAERPLRPKRIPSHPACEGVGHRPRNGSRPSGTQSSHGGSRAPGNARCPRLYRADDRCCPAEHQRASLTSHRRAAVAAGFRLNDGNCRPPPIVFCAPDFNLRCTGGYPRRRRSGWAINRLPALVPLLRKSIHVPKENGPNAAGASPRRTT